MYKKLALVSVTFLGALILGGCNLFGNGGDSVDFFTEAIELIDNREYTEALSLLQQASQNQPGKAETYLEIANIYNLKGNSDDALEAVNVGLENAGDDADLYFLKGELEYSTKAFSDAVVSYEKAISNGYSPKDDAILRKALSYIRQSKFEEAKEVLESEDLSEEGIKFASYYLAVLTTNDVGAAKSILDDIGTTGDVDFDKNVSQLKIVYTDVLKGGEEESTNENYLKLLQGFGLISVDEYEVARTIIEPVARFYETEEKPSYQANLYLGSVLYNLGQYDAALDELKKSIVSNPTEPSTLHLLGLTYSKKNDQVNSLDNFEKATKLDPDNEVLKHDYIKTLKSFNVYSKAELVYIDLIELETAREEEYILDFAIFLNEDLGKGDKAFIHTNRLINEWEGYDQSDASLKATILDTHAWALFLQGDDSGAEDYILQALGQDEYNASAYFHLGKIYEKQERFEEAAVEFARAIDLALDKELSTKANQEYEKLVN